MKLLLSILMMLCFSSAAVAADAGAPPNMAPVRGDVLEATDAGGYTYLRLKTKDGEIWAAVSSTSVKKGAQVTIENAMLMSNFESKALKKHFDKIVFGSLVGSGVSVAVAADIKVAKASGPDAHTVAEIVTKRADLKDKTVVVHGNVVKYTDGVMGKNWIHLRDGTGSASDNSNDILVTTKDPAKLGDVVTAKGVVHIDKDFGSGYAYKVLVEDANLLK